jgi:hypothetical protein
LRLSGLQLRLRFRPLCRNFRRIERRQQFSSADVRSAIHTQRFHEPVHPWIDGDRLKGSQLSWQ